MSAGEQNRPNFQLLISRYRGSGQWERTLSTAQEWLETEPENASAHIAAGQALMNLDRHPEAEAHLRRALASRPDSSTAHRFLSIVLFYARRFKQADEEAKTALSLAPNDHYNWYHLAWMFYRQGDKVSATKYLEKARELAPRDADVINLLAVCTPLDSPLKLRQYEEALALEPENAQIHSNIGAYYLNASRDYEKAGECFRRALFFDPHLKMARENLFLTLKHRDKVYRALRAPRDWVMEGFRFARAARSKSILLYLVLIPLWALLFRFLIAGLALWCLLVWPMIKVYEFLTIGDIRHQAGEVGSRRGGFLGYRKWPIHVRLAIFGGCLLTFWSGLAALVLFGNGSADRETLIGIIVASLFIIGLAGLLFYKIRAWLVRSREKHLSRKRARRVEGILEKVNNR